MLAWAHHPGDRLPRQAFGGQGGRGCLPELETRLPSDEAATHLGPDALEALIWWDTGVTAAVSFSSNRRAHCFRALKYITLRSGQGRQCSLLRTSLLPDLLASGQHPIVILTVWESVHISDRPRLPTVT